MEMMKMKNYLSLFFFTFSLLVEEKGADLAPQLWVECYVSASSVYITGLSSRLLLLLHLLGVF